MEYFCSCLCSLDKEDQAEVSESTYANEDYLFLVLIINIFLFSSHEEQEISS